MVEKRLREEERFRSGFGKGNHGFKRSFVLRKNVTAVMSWIICEGQKRLDETVSKLKKSDKESILD